MQTENAFLYKLFKQQTSQQPNYLCNKTCFTYTYKLGQRIHTTKTEEYPTMCMTEFLPNLASMLFLLELLELDNIISQRISH